MKNAIINRKWVYVLLTEEEAQDLDDLLTQGRGRPHGMGLSPVEADLRRSLRASLKQLARQKRNAA